MTTASVILGTAGHIDHGKTALVRALTGVETDRLAAERERGISIDLGFAPLDLPDGRRLGVVDVPGHERFIRNMLAGASGVDVALLVVAADDSVMPQTREHLAILELLGVPRGVVAITKCDLAEPAWLELVEADVREAVAGGPLAAAPIVRTSSATGAGIDELCAAIAAVTADVAPRDESGAFRLAVDRAFVVEGRGTVVTGSVDAGAASVGDELTCLPSGRAVRVRGIQSHGADVERIAAGRRAALHLAGAHHTEIGRGDVLAAPGSLRASRWLTVEIRVLEDAAAPLRHRDRVRLHLGTAEIISSVRLLDGAAIEPGGRALAQLRLAEPGVARGGQPFVLRRESPLLTIAGGRVLEPTARPRRRRTAPLETLRALASGDVRARLAAVHAMGSTRGWSDADLAREVGASRTALSGALAGLRDDGTLVAVEARGATIDVHRDRLAALERRLVASLEAMHAEDPLATRFARSAVRSRARRGDDVELDAVLDRMVAAGSIDGDGATVGLPDAAPRLTGLQQRVREQVLDRCRAAEFRPPAAAELASATGVGAGALDPVLGVLTRGGELVHLDGGLYLHHEHEAALRARIRAALDDEAALTVSRVRELLGTSRKYAVPMCEHLDRAGVTRREGDVRVAADAAGRHGRSEPCRAS